jgi:hypothetical protein
MKRQGTSAAALNLTGRAVRASHLMKGKKKVTMTASRSRAVAVLDQVQDPILILEGQDQGQGPALAGRGAGLAAAQRVECNHQNPLDSSKLLEESENIPLRNILTC